jgi:hypothetical protein
MSGRATSFESAVAGDFQTMAVTNEVMLLDMDINLMMEAS